MPAETSSQAAFQPGVNHIFMPFLPQPACPSRSNGSNYFTRITQWLSGTWQSRDNLEEKQLQAELRKEYLAQFRAGFKQTLDSIEFVDDKKLN